MTKVPLLDFYRHGHVTQRWEEETRYTLEECYKRLGGHPLPEKVEVRFCQTPFQLADFLQAEKDELGIQTLGDESFICSHDAWRGVSPATDLHRTALCSSCHGTIGYSQA